MTTDGPLLTAEQAKLIGAAHLAFVREQVADGNDGPVPEGRPLPSAGYSDYNQHVPDMEGDGAAWDRYDAEVRHYLGLPTAAESYALIEAIEL